MVRPFSVALIFPLAHNASMNAPVTLPGRFDSLPRFASALKAIESLKPSENLTVNT